MPPPLPTPYFRPLNQCTTFEKFNSGECRAYRGVARPRSGVLPPYPYPLTITNILFLLTFSLPTCFLFFYLSSLTSTLLAICRHAVETGIGEGFKGQMQGDRAGTQGETDSRRAGHHRHRRQDGQGSGHRIDSRDRGQGDRITDRAQGKPPTGSPTADPRRRSRQHWQGTGAETGGNTGRGLSDSRRDHPRSIPP